MWMSSVRFRSFHLALPLANVQGGHRDTETEVWATPERKREKQRQTQRGAGQPQPLIHRGRLTRSLLDDSPHSSLLDGKPVEVDPHHILIEDPDGSCTLILDNLTGVDSGQYMCFAASAAGSASTLGKILVQGEPGGPWGRETP